MIVTPKNQFSLYPILSTQNSYYLFLSFLNIRDLENLYQAIQVGQSNLGNKQKNLILSFIFNRTYINKVDRTMSYYMYENKLVSQIDATAVFTIAQKSIQPVKKIMKNYEKFFAELNFKCGMNSEEVEAFRKIITEPELPLPVSIRSHIGKYCSTNFQLFICSKISNQITLEQESEFDNFKGFINSNQQAYLVNILTSKTLVNSQSILQHIKELYISPLSFINKLQSLSQVNFENNHIFNFITTVFGLTKNLINSIKVQLSALESDPYVYFTEFLLRYSVYKSYILQLQENFSSVFQTFKNLVEQSLNIKTGKLAQSYPYSIWKILTQLFVNEMKAEISNCFPVYVNLVHKLKVQANNRLYLKANSNSYSNFSHEFQKYEGSPALEYLLDSDNIDNIQVFLSDFVQMAVDLSVQESNVLLCGHSEQDLCGVYEKFEETFVNYQIEALKNLCHYNSHLEMQQEIKQQLEFIEKHFNIKPRTLRTILNRMDTEFIQIDFEAVDQQLMQVYRRFFKINDDMITSKNTNKSSITADSDNENNQLDIEGLEYFSQIDEEQTLTEIDI